MNYIERIKQIQNAGYSDKEILLNIGELESIGHPSIREATVEGQIKDILKSNESDSVKVAKFRKLTTEPFSLLD